MAFIYVARSAALSKWAADVGLGKQVYKVGCGDEAPEALAKAGWAGETDWKVLKSVEDEMDEATVLERLGRKEKMLDPNLYPKLKGALGIFKVKEANVENHLLVARALAGQEEIAVKLKPLDFAEYLLKNARK